MFSEKLKQLRKAKGKTQGQVAIALGVSVKNIGSYEEARCNPPYPLLLKICEYYSISIDSLLTANEY